MITEDNLRQIILKYLHGEATDKDRALLENWYYQQGAQQPLNENDLRFLLDHDVIFEQVRRQAGFVNQRAQKRSLIWKSLPYAAALLIISLSVTWLFYFNQAGNGYEIVTSQQADVKSGGNRATLRLADGRQIDLSENQAGIVVSQTGILYEEGKKVLVSLDLGEVTPMELSVPRGGTYQIMLADGTKVWLNSASKLKYPSHFDNQERIVELEGEAYFSVTKGNLEDWPFSVIVDGQTVEVLGTEFNVSAYPGLPKKTTLVSGAVVVENPLSGLTRAISPGEQAIVNGTKLHVEPVDVYKYTAWKDGLFYFKHTPLDELLGEIGRWYDVDVVNEGVLTKETFSGKMRRGLSLMTVLDLLHISTKSDIRLEDRTLIIRDGIPSNK